MDDEQHVIDNRAQYRAKFAQVTPLLASVMDVALPDAGFYLWAAVPERWQGRDTDFACELLAQYNVTVLPGSYLARQARTNPGQGRVRMALVAETAECLEAAHHRSIYPIQSLRFKRFTMSQQLQNIIEAAWDNRANLSPAVAPLKCAVPSSMSSPSSTKVNCASLPAKAWANGRYTSGSKARRCCPSVSKTTC